MECPHCGCDAVVQDKIGSLEQSTCTECGLVVADLLFENDNTNYYFNAPSTGSIPTGIANSMLSVKRKTGTESVSQIGLTEIQNIGKALHLSSSLTLESNELYKQACHNEQLNVRCRYRMFKEVLGACCVYVVLRRHEFPITAADMVALRYFSIADFIVMLRRFKQYMNIEFPRWSIGQLTTYTLSKADFKLDVIKRTQKLLLICDKCWLSEGRKPDMLIYRAAYFSWISFQPSDKITFKTFCKKHKFPILKSDDLFTRMRNLLIKMASNIPWIKSVKAANLKHYIADIVEFRLILMQKAFAIGEETNEDSDELSQSELFTVVRKKRKVEDDSVESQDTIDSEIFAKYGNNLHSVEIGKEEFDDEMDLFIKTDKEIEDAKVIRNLSVKSE